MTQQSPRLTAASASRKCFKRSAFRFPIRLTVVSRSRSDNCPFNTKYTTQKYEWNESKILWHSVSTQNHAGIVPQLAIRRSFPSGVTITGPKASKVTCRVKQTHQQLCVQNSQCVGSICGLYRLPSAHIERNSRCIGFWCWKCELLWFNSLSVVTLSLCACHKDQLYKHEMF